MLRNRPRATGLSNDDILRQGREVRFGDWNVRTIVAAAKWPCSIANPERLRASQQVAVMLTWTANQPSR
jgi:hypothetical protein